MSYDINNRLRQATSRQTEGEVTWDYTVGHLSGSDGVLRRSAYYYGRPDDTGSTASVLQRALSYGSALIPNPGIRDTIATEVPLSVHTRTIEYCGDYRYDYTGLLTSPKVTLQFPQGYRDTDGWHFYLRDHQGSVRLVCMPDCTVEEFCHYYPFGELMAESSYGSFKAQRYTGKESDTWLGPSVIDNSARFKLGAAGTFNSVDRLADHTPGVSPYLFCGADPINHSDPTGLIIEGVSKKDAAMAIEDFRAMFPGEEFADFRDLIVRSGKKQNGKSFAPISPDALSTAFSGITLNEDQQALVDMAVNTINSKDKHKVEYIESTGNLSPSAEIVFAPLFDNPKLPTKFILNVNGGFPVAFIVNEGGGGLTTIIKNGTYSLIFKESSFHLNGRAVTAGHEIIGHGRSLALGRGDQNQHMDAIQTENLILRVMRIPYINTGAQHVPNGAFSGCSLLPMFR